MKDLAMHILDIAQNSIRANASIIEINLSIDTGEEIMNLSIFDNGNGISPEIISKVSDPFYTTRTTRRVGMGLAFLKQNAEATGGTFSIESDGRSFTRTRASFCTSHIDCLPLGDISGAIFLLIYANTNIRIKFAVCLDGNSYQIDTLKIKEIIGDVPLTQPEISDFIRNMIHENVSQIINFPGRNIYE